MPAASPIPITPKPGVVKTEAQRVIEGRWSDSQWVRFKSGKPQKRGGHTVETEDATVGVPRALHAWRDLSQQNFMGAGTAKKLYVYDSQFEQHDITPIDQSGTLGNNPFATTNGQSIVVVTDTAHGRRSGSNVNFDGATVVAGLTIDGDYTVIVALTANTYSINAGSNANATTSGGGAGVNFIYEINAGAEASAYALGYGSGGYGLSTYGSPRETSSLLLEARIWSLHNYGELLYSAYNGGTIYTFDPADLSVDGRAAALTNAPTNVRAMFITEERFPFALCEDMVVRWPDQEDNTVWTAADDNTANERRVTDGTKLVGGLPLAQRISLIWTDNALYLFQYTGRAAVYDSRKVATNCGLISTNSAVVDSDGIAYWQSSHSFHLYNGAVREIPNVEDIKDFVFDNLRTDQPYLCWGYFDPKFREITFFYIVEGASEPELSVTYHIEDQCWTPNDWSEFPRNSATRFQHGDTRPYLGGQDGFIYLHEDGYNADGAAIAAFIEWSPIEMTDGAVNIDLDGIRMDVHNQVGDLTLSLTAYDTLRGDPVDSDEKTVTEDDELIDLRMSGRLIGGRITSDAVDGYFRLGKPLALIKDNGKRR